MIGACGVGLGRPRARAAIGSVRGAGPVHGEAGPSEAGLGALLLGEDG